MGAWGTRIYEDDTALDVRSDYLGLIKSGISHSDAEKQILSTHSYKENIKDYYNDLIILALCCAQLELATLSENIKQKALNIIESGNDIEFWLETGNKESAGLRKRELQLIKKYINSYNEKPVKRQSWLKLQATNKQITNNQNTNPNQTKKSVLNKIFLILALLVILAVLVMLF